MIPLMWVFVAWIALVSVFAILSLITLATTLRYGLSCSSTYLIAGVFVAVAVGAVLMTLGYAASLDLTQNFDVMSFL